MRHGSRGAAPSQANQLAQRNGFRLLCILPIFGTVRAFLRGRPARRPVLRQRLIPFDIKLF
jgi:hypothetical protein